MRRFVFASFQLFFGLIHFTNFAQETRVSDSTRFKSVLEQVREYDGEPSKNLDLGEELVVLAQKLGDRRKEATAFIELHHIHRDLGNLTTANQYYLTALKIFEELGRKDDMAASYAQEASLLMLEGQYQQSVNEYLKSIQIYLELKDTFMTNVIRVNVGETYRLYEKHDSAALFLKKALEDNYSKDEIVEGYGTGNLGMVYYALDRLDSARSLLEQSISILEPLGDVYSVTVYEFELGKVFVAQGDRIAGEEKMLKAYEVALQEGLKEQVRDFSQHLAEYFAGNEDYRVALAYQRQYETYKDSLINIDNVRKVEQLRGQHQVEQRESEITFLSELNKSQRTTLWVVGSGSVILLVLLGLLYRNNQEKKKANEALAKREKEKGLLLSELNHRTKNNLNMISSLLNLQSNELGDEPAAEAVRQGRYRVDSLALIHQKLYKEDYSSIHMEQYLQELLEHLNESFDPDVTMDATILPEAMKVDRAIPLALIVNELVTNALKYGKAPNGDSLIRVSLEAVGTDYRLCIRDNGPGMPEPQLDELSSFGLKLIYSLTDQLEGTLYFRNVNGAEWTITFPK